MKLGVIGAGYVGVVAAACFGEKGNDVVLMDADKDKIKSFSNGIIPFYEQGLEELVKNTMQRGHLRLTTSIGDAVRDSEVIFIAVGTPQGESDVVNTNHVVKATEEVGSLISASTDFKVLAVKSTVLPGTTRNLVSILSDYRNPQTFAVVSNPEFLKEGSAVDDFRRPDRVIIGIDNERAERLLRELYSQFMTKKDRLIVMGIESAELTKYAANVMLATRVALINEIALLAGQIGADIEDVRKGIGLDPRIGLEFLYPGPGFGGSCFPKDLRGIVQFAGSLGMDFSIPEAVLASNERQRYWPAEALKKYFNGSIRGKTFAIWGAAFKQRTGDTRESSAIYVTRRLLDYGAEVRIYDPEPQALKSFKDKFNDKITCCDNVYGVLEGASAVLILTDWDEFRGINLAEVKNKLKNPVIIDGRNIYKDLGKMRTQGFDYISLGRPPIFARSK